MITSKDPAKQNAAGLRAGPCGHCCCCCITSVVSDSVRPHRRQPTRLPRPWHSPGKNAGVGCHFLLQCMKVKSEREVAQSCPTLSDPMDCSLPGSSVHGICQARLLGWGAIAFSTPLTHSGTKQLQHSVRAGRHSLGPVGSVSQRLSSLLSSHQGRV